MPDIFSNLQERILKGETDEAAALLRMAMPGLAKELKQEWRDCAKLCAKLRKENWKADGVQGKSRDGSMQSTMKLPRLAQMALDKEFGDGKWVGSKKAMDWAWKEWPQFRTIERK